MLTSSSQVSITKFYLIKKHILMNNAINEMSQQSLLLQMCTFLKILKIKTAWLYHYL